MNREFWLINRKEIFWAVWAVALLAVCIAFCCVYKDVHTDKPTFVIQQDGDEWHIITYDVKPIDITLVVERNGIVYKRTFTMSLAYTLSGTENIRLINASAKYNNSGIWKEWEKLPKK